MQEITHQALVIARAMWHRRWTGLAVAWLVAIIGSIVLLRIPDRYEASAKIYVDTQTVLRPLMSGLAVQPDTTQVVTMMARTLITRPNVEKLMRNTDLDLSAGTQVDKDKIVDELIKDIKLSGGRENLYELSYRNSSPELEARIAQLNQQLDELTRRYTEQHPDVVMLRRQIAQIEEQKSERLEARRKAAAAQGSRVSPSTNPVFQQIKISLAESEANIASLRGRVSELEGRMGTLRASAARAPQLEAEHTQLTRDYEVLKRNYEQLVVRRETATISEGVDAGARFADFRVIDPPRVSPRPVFPNRIALIPMVLLVAIGAGLLVTFAVSQVFPTVQSVRMLRNLSVRPVLGSISLQIDDSRQARERRLNVLFGGAVGMLMLINLGWALLTALRTVT